MLRSGTSVADKIAAAATVAAARARRREFIAEAA
jgi:hypothetical protein